MMSKKESAYKLLVEKRKDFHFEELLNPSEIEGGRYDCEHAELWAQWMGNLNANILLIGKDFGGKDFLLRFRGRCDPSSTTNNNLIELFDVLDIDIGTPDRPNDSAPVFFTNSIFGLLESPSKGGNPIPLRMLRESAIQFLRPLINLIDPKIIVAMGEDAYKGVRIALEMAGPETLSQALEIAPLVSSGFRVVFPVFHCGRLGLLNRCLELQKSDWLKIKMYLEQEEMKKQHGRT